MFLYSQKDPAYDRKTLGNSNLTVHGYGCFLVSMANLFQRSPVELLSVPNGITPDGLLNASVIAKYCGGAYTGQFDSGLGWQIAQTDHYAPQGFPTHFFLVNQQTKEQVDPLDFPAKVEPLTYHIVNVRVFTGTKFVPAQLPPVGPFPDIEPDRWSAPVIAEAKALGFVSGYADGTFKPTQPISREEAVALVMKARKA